MFSCEFCEISKNTFFTEHLWATGSVNKKNRNIFCYKTTNLQQTDFCFWFLEKDKKGVKANLNLIYRNESWQLFSSKNVFQIVKPLLHSVLLLITWNRKS